MKIALTGNPNSGKTTLFNAITGKIEKVGNWPGVTVEKKEGYVKSNLNDTGVEMLAVDLPGAYSMSPYTSEESITRDFVKNESPDVIINIVDSTSLSRSLFFTTQLLELGIPVVVALNKSDLLNKKAIDVDAQTLSKKLGCPVVNTVSTSSNNNGLKELISACAKVVNGMQAAPFATSNVDWNNRESVKNSDKARFDFVTGIVSAVENRKVSSSESTLQDKVDKVVTHPILGLIIFFCIMWWGVFAISQEHLGPYLADALVGWLEAFQGYVGDMIVESVSPFWHALLVDGIIGGVVAIIGFLPLIMVLFFMLALLEDCGYMARVAALMDRYFKLVGLSGKSIIPMVVSTGCAIPGVMATRTIKNVRQRRTTAMLAPFMPCGAKLPVIALFSGVFFNNSSWVGTSMYFLAIAVIIVGALIVKQITGDIGKTKGFFILEMPEYRWPSIKRAVISTLSRAKAFIIKAGTIILVCNALVMVMQSFNWQLQYVSEEAANTSILASISSPFAWLLIPLGFGVWQLAAAAITGFIAKENVVGTLAVVFGISNFIDTDALELVSGADSVAGVMGLSAVAALSYLIFNLFTPPCFAAIGSMNAEMEDAKWLWGGVLFQFAMGYVLAFFTYQIGSLITAGQLGGGFFPGAIAVGIIIAIVIMLMIKGRSEAKLENAMSAK